MMFPAGGVIDSYKDLPALREHGFSYKEMGEAPLLDANEKVLNDCIQGDQMPFWHQEVLNGQGPF